MKRANNFIAGLTDTLMYCVRIALLLPLLAVLTPRYALAGAPDALVLALMTTAEPETAVVAAVTTVRIMDTRLAVARAAVADSEIIWLPMPPVSTAAVIPGLLEMNYQELKSSPNLAQATARRTINTVAALADNYQFSRVAELLRGLNDRQNAVYVRLKDLHQRYIADNHIDIRRTRQDGESMYVLGYRGSF